MYNYSQKLSPEKMNELLRKVLDENQPIQFVDAPILNELTNLFGLPDASTMEFSDRIGLLKGKIIDICRDEK